MQTRSNAAAFLGRRAFIEPERIVSSFGLEKGDFVADFGAGHGFFTIPMARAVGGDGKVFAIDVQKAALDVIRARARTEHLLNIEYVWADLDLPNGSHLKDEYVDFVVISNILYQAEQKNVYTAEAYRILRPGSRLAIIEWDQSPDPLGPPADMRMRKEVVKSLAVEAGFDHIGEFDAGTHHYGLLFKKS